MARDLGLDRSTVRTRVEKADAGKLVDAPGGCIVIVDALPAEDQSASFLSAYGMHLAMRLPGARPHAPAHLRAWLAEAGYARVYHRVLDGTGLVGALVAYA